MRYACFHKCDSVLWHSLDVLQLPQGNNHPMLCFLQQPDCLTSHYLAWLLHVLLPTAQVAIAIGMLALIDQHLMGIKWIYDGPLLQVWYGNTAVPRSKLMICNGPADMLRWAGCTMRTCNIICRCCRCIADVALSTLQAVTPACHLRSSSGLLWLARSDACSQHTLPAQPNSNSILLTNLTSSHVHLLCCGVVAAVPRQAHHHILLPAVTKQCI